MRFNDRISMRSSTELREPFLDHRLFELAMRQSTDRKISDGIGKKMLRDISRNLLPSKVTESPKRALQTPQREWLRGELRSWTEDMVNTALTGQFGGWLQRAQVKSELDRFMRGESDNSFYVWQWISLGLATEAAKHPMSAAV
jgi:asparagine synthase (glutamine-hydrolysing)